MWRGIILSWTESAVGGTWPHSNELSSNLAASRTLSRGPQWSRPFIIQLRSPAAILGCSAPRTSFGCSGGCGGLTFASGPCVRVNLGALWGRLPCCVRTSRVSRCPRACLSSRNLLMSLLDVTVQGLQGPAAADLGRIERMVF